MQLIQTPMTDKRQSDQATNWRAVWRLLKPYWISEERWKARGLLATVVVLALGMVYLNVLFNEWNRVFYNALESKDFVTFKAQLWRFSYLAFIYIGVAIYKVYLTQALEIRWRGWMTRQYMDGWLSRQVYYRIEQASTADNPDQRIAEDLKFLTNGSLTLSLGLLSSVVTLVSFIGILWSVSGPLAFMLGGRDWVIPGYMVWFALAYAGTGSFLVARIGKPLVQQNFLQQRFEADSGECRIGGAVPGRAAGACATRQPLRAHTGKLVADHAHDQAPQRRVHLLCAVRHHFPLPGGRTALFQRRDHTGRPDADIVRFRAGAVGAVLVHRRLYFVGRVESQRQPAVGFSCSRRDSFPCAVRHRGGAQ
jgi:hypothetical protein